MALDSCNLVDMGWQGYKFTWNKRQSVETNTRQKLDHVVANREWRNKFLVSFVTHLFSHASGHLPIMLQVGTKRCFRGRGVWGFKFEEVWLLWEDCEAVVGEAWDTTSGGGSFLVEVRDKIGRCGAQLHG